MKFAGLIGFYEKDVEVKPGIFEPVIVEKKYYGDVQRNIRRFQGTEYQNDTLVSNNQISILTDLYLQENWPSIKYVVWNGAKLKVTSVDLLNYPRAILEVGGAYNDCSK